MSHDPAAQFASPYAYGPGDPINGSDATGAFWEGLFFAFGVALFFATAELIWQGTTTGNWSGALKNFGLSVAVAAAGVAIGGLVGFGISQIPSQSLQLAVSGALGLAGGVYGGYSWVNDGGSPIGLVSVFSSLTLLAYGIDRAADELATSATINGNETLSQSGAQLGKGADVSDTGGTWDLWRACNGGDGGACSTLEAVNRADLNDALGHIRQDSPDILDRLGGDPDIAFNGTEDFVNAKSGATDLVGGRVHLARAYSSKTAFIDTVAHELQHSGNGFFGRARTLFQDVRSPTGLGPRHTAIINRAGAIAGRYKP